MEFIVLLENSKRDDSFRCNHGLSVYIEAEGKKILLDTGQDDNFIYNAQILGVDISSVDFAAISHFHYDHAGGLKDFIRLNKKAKIYIGKEAFADYYVSDNGEMKIFGMDKELFDPERFILVDQELEVAENIKIYSKLNYGFDNPLNDKFYKRIGKDYIKDDFIHETALMINEGENGVLLSGCFHSGVVNAAKRVAENEGKITHIMGGFHLEGSGEAAITPGYFKELTDYLLLNGIKCYTGHCTGACYMAKLEDMLPELFLPIYTGSRYLI